LVVIYRIEISYPHSVCDFERNVNPACRLAGIFGLSCKKLVTFDTSICGDRGRVQKEMRINIELIAMIEDEEIEQ
jgi:hypothetical protein